MASLVEKRLGTLPQDLRKIYHETYTERFDEYQEEEAAIAQSALRWLICSQVPLNTETFLALASSSAYQRPTVAISCDDLLDLASTLLFMILGSTFFDSRTCQFESTLKAQNTINLEAATRLLRSIASRL